MGWAEGGGGREREGWGGHRRGGGALTDQFSGGTNGYLKKVQIPRFVSDYPVGWTFGDIISFSHLADGHWTRLDTLRLGTHRRATSRPLDHHKGTVWLAITSQRTAFPSDSL